VIAVIADIAVIGKSNAYRGTTRMNADQKKAIRKEPRARSQKPKAKSLTTDRHGFTIFDPCKSLIRLNP
jgi:hypothetical protein